MEEARSLADLVWHLLVAAGSGLLIGLEREYAKRVREQHQQFAGVRTHTLIAVSGFLTAWLAEVYGSWLFAVGFAGLLALVVASYVLLAKEGSYGGTSELSSVITFLIGAVVFRGEVLFALVLTVAVILLLSFKVSLHRFAGRLEATDIRAFAQFLIISALVLPFLPDASYGPYGVWNPREIWTMVVLVSGISLAGYLAMKVLDRGRGTLWTAVLGGLVSSTATTLHFARRSRQEGPAATRRLGLGVLAACTMMFPRVLLEAGVVHQATAGELLTPVLLLAISGLSVFRVLQARTRTAPDGRPDEVQVANPLNLRVAIQFALIYAAVKWVVAYATEHFGDQGAYVAGGLSGLTDVDAISLSMARFARDGGEVDLAANVMVLAMLANTLVKYLIVAFAGTKALRRHLLAGFLVLLAPGLVWLLARWLA